MNAVTKYNPISILDAENTRLHTYVRMGPRLPSGKAFVVLPSRGILNICSTPRAGLQVPSHLHLIPQRDTSNSNPKYPNATGTMSFGFGVGDFLAVGKLVWDVYRAYADAPEQFRNFSQEILSLHVVLGKVEEQLYNTTTFSRQDTDNLRILYHGLKTTMEALDALLKKYQRLSENRYRSRSFDRLKWGQEDFVGLREKLRSNITLLTAFNSSLAKYVPCCLTCMPLLGFCY